MFVLLLRRDMPVFISHTTADVAISRQVYDRLAQYYKQQATIVKRSLVEKYAAASEGIAGVEDFHRQPNAALRQRSAARSNPVQPKESTMAKTRVFISFDYDHDEGAK